MFPFNIITRPFIKRTLYLTLGLLIIGAIIGMFFTPTNTAWPQAKGISQKHGDAAGLDVRELERQMIKESFNDSVRLNAARAGNPVSMAELGLRENHDTIEKYKWLRLSALHGSKECEDRANSMEKDLMKEQKEEADRRIQAELTTIAFNKKKDEELLKNFRQTQKNQPDKTSKSDK